MTISRWDVWRILTARDLLNELYVETYVGLFDSKEAALAYCREKPGKYRVQEDKSSVVLDDTGPGVALRRTTL